jgi:hypothetical protein
VLAGPVEEGEFREAAGPVAVEEFLAAEVESLAAEVESLAAAVAAE